MNVQDMAWYRLWSAFMEAASVFFGLYSIELFERKVCPGVTAISAQGGALVYTLAIMKEKSDFPEMAEVLDLDQELHRYFCQQRMIVKLLGDVIFFRISGAMGSSPSLMVSDRGLELFVPSQLLAGRSYPEMEEHWDAFAKMVYRALL
ncbi:MAG: hypothetical protein WAU28_04005 [Candidatus Moraniibacteriota bacterium]